MIPTAGITPVPLAFLAKNMHRKDGVPIIVSNCSTAFGVIARNLFHWMSAAVDPTVCMEPSGKQG